MSEFAVALVLSAAVLHATWNAIVKGTRARALVLAAVAGTHGTVGLLMLLWFEFPQPASWPYIAASATTHYGYYYFLSLAYKWGDLSRVYPISRGIAPLLVSLGALIFAGEQLSAPGWGGIALVSAGICLLAFFSKGPSVPDPRSTAAAVERGSGTLGPLEKKASRQMPAETRAMPPQPGAESCSPAKISAPRETSSGAIPREMG